jgi:hypothetical protein
MRSFAWVALSWAVTGGAAALAFRPENAGTTTFPLLVLAASAILAAAALFVAHRNGELADWLTPKWGDFSGGAATAIALFAVMYGVVKVLAPNGSVRQAWLLRLYLQMGPPSVLREKAALVGAAIVLFAITDALVWRGLVPSALAERFGSRSAWIVAGALYGLAYVPAALILREGGAGPNLLLVAGALATGWILGATTRFFRRLAPGIVGHALFAWFALMTYRFFAPSV